MLHLPGSVFISIVNVTMTYKDNVAELAEHPVA